MNYYKVAIPLNINKLYSYKSKSNIQKGSRVLISFHNKHYTGIIWGKTKKKVILITKLY